MTDARHSVTDAPFTPQDLVLFQARLKQLMVGSAKAPFIATIIGLLCVTLGVVAYIEYEIIYRVFEYLSGDNGYWSPEIMGLTAVVMILGFHLLAKAFPNNVAARFVTTAVQFLIPLYMVGVGLLIASIMDVWSLIDEAPPIFLGGLPEPTEPHWLQTLLMGVTDPLGATTFSLGLGGLAVVNIFVAHELINKISANVTDLSGRMSAVKRALANYAVIKRVHKRYGQCVLELQKLGLWNDEVIRMTVASTAIQERDEGLRPHKEWLADQRLGDRSPFTLQDNADPAEISKMMKPLEAISLQDVLDAISPSIQLENLR